eukprot:6200126-Pleurochrysis_carterae.AAC.2
MATADRIWTLSCSTPARQPSKPPEVTMGVRTAIGTEGIVCARQRRRRLSEGGGREARSQSTLGQGASARVIDRGPWTP